MNSKQVNNTKGLSRSNQNLTVGIFVVILLIWGPIEPYGMIFRIIYLVVLPVLLWLILRYFGSKWNAGTLENDRLTRGIAGALAGAFFVGACIYLTADFHTSCTEGGDCMTDVGPNYLSVLVLVGLGIVSAWYAISEHKQES